MEVGKIREDNTAQGITYRDDSSGEVRTTLNERWVTKLEKLGDKLEALTNTEGVSEKKLAEAQKKFDKQASFIEKLVEHEGVHQGDFEANGESTDNYSKKDAEEKSVQGFKSPNNERGWDYEKEVYD